MHATIAGVVLGLITPAVPFHPPVAIDAAVDTIERRPGLSVEELRAALALLNESVAPLDRLEAALHPWTSYVIVPIFALANAGVRLGGGVSGTGARVTVGVVVGLVVGKAVGVGGASWLVVRLGWGTKPSGVSWAQFFGVAALAGIGFTMSLFVTDLAFAPNLTGAALTHHAKIGVLLASLLAALIRLAGPGARVEEGCRGRGGGARHPGWGCVDRRRPTRRPWAWVGRDRAGRGGSDGPRTVTPPS